MIKYVRSHAISIAIFSSLALAAASGFLANVALGIGSAGAPTATTTINVGTGEQGPAGPPGPPGPPGPAGGGADSCPTGSTFKAVVVSAPGGHVEMWVCVKS